jgi:RNA polymerase sigma-70 factor (ECF subfamily)
MPNPLPQVSAAVLVRAQRGDPAAHAEIYGLFAATVFTLARRMLASRPLAEDVLQDTFVEVIRNVRNYRGDAEFGFWLKRIAINKCLMHLRSAWTSRRSADGDEVLAQLPGRAVGLDDQIALERALDGLSDTARIVVWLHDVEGHTHKEIGRMMGHTASFSKSQLARAHDRLRLLLQGGLEEGETELCTPALKTC